MPPGWRACAVFGGVCRCTLFPGAPPRFLATRVPRTARPLDGQSSGCSGQRGRGGLAACQARAGWGHGWMGVGGRWCARGAGVVVVPPGGPRWWQQTPHGATLQWIHFPAFADPACAVVPCRRLSAAVQKCRSAQKVDKLPSRHGCRCTDCKNDAKSIILATSARPVRHVPFICERERGGALNTRLRYTPYIECVWYKIGNTIIWFGTRVHWQWLGQVASLLAEGIAQTQNKF